MLTQNVVDLLFKVGDLLHEFMISLLEANVALLSPMDDFCILEFGLLLHELAESIIKQGFLLGHREDQALVVIFFCFDLLEPFFAVLQLYINLSQLGFESVN